MLFLKKSYGVIALRPVPHGGLVAQEGGCIFVSTLFANLKNIFNQVPINILLWRIPLYL
jgi:hypothetical protein